MLGSRRGRMTSRHGAARQRELAVQKIPRDARLTALSATAKKHAAARSNMQLSTALMARSMHVLWRMASCSRIVRGALFAALQMRVARFPKCHRSSPGRARKTVIRRRQQPIPHVPHTIAKTATTTGRADGTMGSRPGAVSTSAARVRKRLLHRRQQIQGILTARLALQTGRTSGTRVSRHGVAFIETVLVLFPALPGQQPQQFPQRLHL